MVQDEVEAEVEHGERLRLVAQAGHRSGQGFAFVIGDEGEEGGEPGLRGGERRRFPVVVLGADMEMAVDEPREDEAAARVDHPVCRREKLLRAQSGDLVALDGHGGFNDVRGGHDLAAADDGVDSGAGHRGSSWTKEYARWPVTLIGVTPSPSPAGGASGSAGAGDGRGSSSACGSASSGRDRSGTRSARRR